MINHEEEKIQTAYKESIVDSTQEAPLTEEEAYVKKTILEHYDDEEEGYGRFMDDYVNTLNTPALASFYHVADNADNQALLDLVFDAALAQWRGSLSGTA